MPVALSTRGYVCLAAFLLVTPAVMLAQLPSSDLTPGKTVKVSKEEVCAANFTSPAKPMSNYTKEDTLSRYGIRSDSGRELFPLVPLSLGGSNDGENLWPLPASKTMGPEQKEALDEKMLKLVCDGTISLKDAQNAIKKDWVKAYQKYVVGSGS